MVTKKTDIRNMCKKLENSAMRKTSWVGVVLLFLSISAWAAEVGLVTAVSGAVTLQDEKSAAGALKPFVKVRDGDRLMLQDGSRLQIVFFDGGRQETWQGAGALEIGNTASKVLKGNLQPEIRILPAILVKQLTKTPSPDGSVKTGMIRMRSVPTPEKVELAEKSYADFRKQSDPADRNPEIFIFAAYFELREFDKLEALLKLLGERSPKDPELNALIELYAGAVKKARELLSK
jgi:hypothetical protein